MTRSLGKFVGLSDIGNFYSATYIKWLLQIAQVCKVADNRRLTCVSSDDRTLGQVDTSFDIPTTNFPAHNPVTTGMITARTIAISGPIFMKTVTVKPRIRENMLASPEFSPKNAPIIEKTEIPNRLNYTELKRIAQ